MPSLLLAVEDPLRRREIFTWFQELFPSAHLRCLEAWEDLGPAVSTLPPPAVVVTDPFWGGLNRAEDILLMSEEWPAATWVLLSEEPASALGLPLLCAPPDEQLPLRITEGLENLSGHAAGPYQILAPAGPHLLGRLYWAHHRQLRRDVQILVPPLGSAQFSESIQAWARLHHPSVYALYESVLWDQRTLVASEPVRDP